MSRRRVVVVEPYYGGSHRAWADGLAAHSSHEVRLLTHEDQFWRWRMRGGSVTLAEALTTHVDRVGRPDVLVVSDMVDAAALLGLVRRTIGDIPVGAYFHENQLVYPLGPTQKLDEGLALVNWKTMVAADRIWFNSEFHRGVVFDALRDLLGRPVDHRHEHLVAGVAARSFVLPVGVELADLVSAHRGPAGTPPLVLWNQRWDHDKNPEAVFKALAKLAAEGLGFELALAGENSRVHPREFDQVRALLGDRVVHVGELPRDEYLDLLVRADVVVTAAHHEFFGIAMVEAMAAGAVPVLPDRLSYPEVVPPRFHADVLYADGELRQALRHALTHTADLQERLGPLRAEMLRYDWTVLAPRYDAELDELASR